MGQRVEDGALDEFLHRRREAKLVQKAAGHHQLLKLHGKKAQKELLHEIEVEADGREGGIVFSGNHPTCDVNA